MLNPNLRSAKFYELTFKVSQESNQEDFTKKSEKKFLKYIFFIINNYDFLRIFGVNLRSRKIFGISEICKISIYAIFIENYKDFSRAHIVSKNSENKRRSFLIKIYTSVNFFRIFGANVRFLSECFYLE